MTKILEQFLFSSIRLGSRYLFCLFHVISYTRRSEFFGFLSILQGLGVTLASFHVNFSHQSIINVSKAGRDPCSLSFSITFLQKTCFSEFFWTFLRTFCFCFASRSLRRLITLHKRRQKWRFLAKLQNFNCFNLFITQDYSGKHLRIVKAWKKVSFEICHSFQIDLDKKIFRNQNHYISY